MLWLTPGNLFLMLDYIAHSEYMGRCHALLIPMENMPISEQIQWKVGCGGEGGQKGKRGKRGGREGYSWDIK